MANVYVRSGAAGAGTGADWTNAYTKLNTALTAKAAGDTFWVADDHAETTAAAITHTSPGTISNPCFIYCVNRAGSVPPVAADLRTSATVTTTGNSGISFDGFAYCHGVGFNAGSAASGAANYSFGVGTSFTWRFNACAVRMGTTNVSGTFNFGTATANLVQQLSFVNTTFQFGATAQSLVLRGANVVWSDTPSAIVGATLPTTLFATSTSSFGMRADIDAVDLSALGSGKTLVGALSAGQRFRLINCKLGASVTVAATPTAVGAEVALIGSHSSTTVERNELYGYYGTLTTETTIIRTTGASDGTTAYSWKVVTTANSKRTFPFETFEGAVWNTTLSSQTLTVHCVTDNVTLTDAEIWVEVEYLASAATPVTTLITDANATVLTTPQNQTSDSGEAWTTTGIATPLKQALAVTFTPAMVGPIRWKVKVAKASATVYIDPNVDLA